MSAIRPPFKKISFWEKMRPQKKLVKVLGFVALVTMGILLFNTEVLSISSEVIGALVDWLPDIELRVHVDLYSSSVVSFDQS